MQQLRGVRLTPTRREVRDWFESAIAVEEAPRAKLAALFEAVATLAASPQCLGCTFQGTAAGFPAQDHPGHRAARAHKEAVLDRLRELAAHAGARQPAELVRALLLVMDGAFAARMFGARSPARPLLRPPPRSLTRSCPRGGPARGGPAAAVSAKHAAMNAVELGKRDPDRAAGRGRDVVGQPLADRLRRRRLPEEEARRPEASLAAGVTLVAPPRPTAAVTPSRPLTSETRTMPIARRVLPAVLAVALTLAP
jgi:hypothetical protein